MINRCCTILAISLIILIQPAFSQFTQYVNPFIGTGGHGHTYPGATLPFGFVQLSPDTRPDGYSDWDGCGGYHYSDSVIYGFSHTHLSGTGVADYCDILLMPTTGEVQLNNISENNPAKGYASGFSHATEKASPGYYTVVLKDGNIPVELTATERTGMHKYNFPEKGKLNIILDLNHRDRLLEGSYIEVISPTKVQGLRRSSSWAKDQWLYFAIEFSQPFIYAGIKDSAGLENINAKQFHSAIVSDTELSAFFQFSTNGKDPVYVKCALSPVSCAGAWKNLAAENPGWDFEKIKKEAERKWNDALGKIEVKDISESKKSLTDPTNQLVIFYSALYHCMLAPNIYEDVDGKYRGRDNLIHIASGFDYYTVFSLWDTFRGEHPLFTIIDTKRTSDFINTFLMQYQQGGRLPVWELSSNETNCMIGYHSVPVITDAAVKGIRGFDMPLALEAMKHSANAEEGGLRFYKSKGFIESNEEPESVSKTLEYAYDDWCIAQFSSLVPEEPGIKFDAEVIPENDDYTYFRERSFNYLNLINKDLFARPRFNGGWYKPFDPFEVNFNYTEANAWQYAFFFPQYFNTINRPEDKKRYENALDALFTANHSTTGREQSDITGMIGQYAHGNEPSHHIAYMYNYLNVSWKTQERVAEIMHNFYKNAPDGLIGNEDCGQMSAWYVLSAMGIFSVCPGSTEYALTTPLFDSVVIHCASGKTFSISAPRKEEQDLYTNYALLNNTLYPGSFIDHNTIISGGTLSFATAPVKNTDWGNRFDARIVRKPVMAPVIETSAASFRDTLQISIIPLNGDENFYTINDPDVYQNGILYTGPFITDSSVTVYAYCKDATGQVSKISTGRFSKLNADYSIHYLTENDHQYTGGGNNTLIDGLRGGDDYRTGMWQGWQGQNVELVLDMGRKKQISSAGGGFLQDVRSWVWMPSKLEILISNNGKKFKSVAIISNTIDGTNYDSKEIQDMIAHFDPVKARYIKFIAYNAGPVPAWHPGAGGKSWIFADEIWVK